MAFDIKIFVSHRIDLESKIINESIYYPVRCGAIFDNNFKTIIGDNSGNNISEKKDSYCELTVQYWAWKNIEADYYGLCHYRRYLSSTNINYQRGNSEKDNGCILMDFISEDNIFKYGLDSNSITSLVESYDVICCEDIKVNKLNNYELMVKHFKYHNVEDMYLAINILKHKYPEFADIADDYMNGHSTRLYNCFVMKAEVFKKYSAWLFDILFELEKHLDMSDYGITKYRTPGTIGERLFGIYILFLQKQKKYSVKEVPLVFIKDVNPNLPLLPETDNSINIVTLLKDIDVPIYMTSLISILAHISSEYIYQINILSFDLSELSKEMIIYKAIKFKNVKINFYDPRIFLIKYENDLVDPIYFPFSHVKILLPYVLSNYSKILYLEFNTICLKDVSFLFNLNPDNHYVCAVEDIIKFGQLNSNISNIQNEKNLHDIIYFNSNVMLLNCFLIRKHWQLETLKEVIENSSKNISTQDIMNSILSDKLLLIDNNWNVMSNSSDSLEKIIELAPRNLFLKYKDACKDPYIINFHCDEKPWDFKVATNCFSILWWEYTKSNPFYEKIIGKMSLLQYENMSNEELFFDITNYRINLFKFLIFKFLSIITFRKFGKNKVKKLRFKIKKVKDLRKKVNET